MQRSVFVNVLALAFLFLTGCMHQPRATRDQSASIEHVANSPIAVTTRNGAIEVIADATTGSTVQINAKITCGGQTQEEADQRLALATLNVARDVDNLLTISATFPGQSRSNDGASFTIHLPDADGVDLRTSNGKIRIAGLGGLTTLKSSNGAITVQNHDGLVDITTSNGAITVADLAGDLSASTSNGSANITDLDGSAKVRSSNGSITLSLHPEHSGPIDLRTSNGSIRAKVGKVFAGTVKFDTSNGRITIDDPANRITSKTMEKKHGVATVGSGGEPSSLSTSNGSIVLDIAP